MSDDAVLERAPCGYLETTLDGRILRVNRTFEEWTGLRREQLLGGTRFADLLPAGARMFHDTHVAPLLRLQGAVRGVALDVVRADGSRLPALVSASVDGDPAVVRTMLFDASGRRRYERELLAAGRREHDIAHELQRSMLAGTLPDPPGLQLGVGYRPATSQLEIGGDWYDAFWARDGAAVALVVGDVVGRGLHAAAVMGQLRSAIRALALTGLSPGPLLDALDAYARRHGVGQSATVVVAELELATGVLRHACAGHPPPVLLRDGAAELLWGGRSMPLDVADGATSRPEAAQALEPGTTVLLYTDGLVERRGERLEDGIGRLAEAALARDGEDAAALAQGVVHELQDDADPDDVCVLAVRVR